MADDLQTSDIAFLAAVVHDLAGWRFQCVADDVKADLLVALGFCAGGLHGSDRPEEYDPAADDHAFLSGSLGGV